MDRLTETYLRRAETAYTPEAEDAPALVNEIRRLRGLIAAGLDPEHVVDGFDHTIVSLSTELRAEAEAIRAEEFSKKLSEIEAIGLDRDLIHGAPKRQP